MAFVALPYAMTVLGSALPVIGEGIADLLAFTGASALIDDVIKVVSPEQKPVTEQNNDINKQNIIDIKNKEEMAADIGDGLEHGGHLLTTLRKI